MKATLLRRLFASFALACTLFALPAAAQDTAEPASPQPARWSIAIHGGAGTMSREAMTPEQEAEYRAALDRALAAGIAVLDSGGTALDAVVAGVTTMEDDPHFNAGRGAVFTWDGTNSLDAAIMDGKTRKAGAVSGLSRTSAAHSDPSKMAESRKHQKS